MWSTSLALTRKATGAALKRAFTLVELLVVIAIIGALAGLLIPAIRAARASSKNAACKNNLRQMGIALDLYNDAQGSYPVDGHNGFGIGAFLLPYLEQKSLFEQLKPLSKASANEQLPLVNTYLEVFVCPSFARRSPDGASPASGPSNYRGNSNIFSRATIYDDIRDGESNTIAMGETMKQHAWAKPGLAGASPPQDGGEYSSRHGGGANFVFCDASVHFIGEDIDPAVFTALCTIDGRETNGEWK
jgi:prepilin-type N-terminal cleavage/methylation domain-containing protein/prepilin-type processing-associated H-X9-DG protein